MEDPDKVIEVFDNVPLTEPLPPIAPVGSADLNQWLSGFLQNPVFGSTSRPAFKAIVGPTNTGGVDYTDIQQAINYVNDTGGGLVFIRAGSYRLLSDLTLYSNVGLVGEDGTILVSGSGVGTLKIEGTFVTSTGSSVSLVNGSVNVGGSGTNFMGDGIASGDSFYIKGVPYTVDTVVSNTSLNLTRAYQGRTTASNVGDYYVTRPKKTCLVRNIKFQSDTSTNILSLKYTEDCLIEFCIFDKYNYAVSITNSFNYLVRNCRAGSGVVGFVVNPPGGTTSLITSGVIFQCTSVANSSYGFYVYRAKSVTIANCWAVSNNSYGIFIDGGFDHLIINNEANNNNSTGIYLEGNSGSQ